MNDESIKCPNCKAYHDDIFLQNFPDKKDEVDYLRAVCEQFDPNRLCILCKLPVYALSMGGPTICPSCDCGHPRLREDAEIHFIAREIG